MSDEGDDRSAGSAVDRLFDLSTDLGRSYAAVDWSATPLGDPTTWSDSLQTAVRMMLSSRFAMWMGWGAELTFFCNEAYRRDTLAGKYPWALGRATSEVWSEIWDQISDRVDAVTVAGESTWDEGLQLFVQRSGYSEETFHTFSYSPLTEGDGTISGLLCVVSEVTTATVDARRVNTLTELTAGLARAATEDEIVAEARQRLGANPADLPFVAGYVTLDDATEAALAWTCGQGASVPATVDLSDGGPWAAAMRTGSGVLDLATTSQDDVPAGVERAAHAVVAGLAPPGSANPVGFLVVGVSRHRPLDEAYEEFVRLLASQLGAALARARAYAAERDYAQQIAAREHAVAQELQASLLPAHDFDADHLDVATFYRSGVEGTSVGGDWYDVIDLGPGRTALVIGDVMGRGVQAAAVMGQLRATARAYARLELSPDIVLGLLDETVRELGANKIVTCVYAVYDPSDHSLVYANAGHLPPLLTVPGEGTRQLLGSGPPLGTGRGWPPAQTVNLPVGATLTLYTDGLVERRGTDVDVGIAQMTSLLDTVSGAVDAVPDRLAAALMPDGSDDDIAILAAQVSERARHDHVARIDLTHDSRHVAQAREFVRTHLLDWGVDDDSAYDAQLVASELVTNAFVHARSDARLVIRVSGGKLFIEVRDLVASIPRPRNALPSDTSGRGLSIVATVAHRWGTRQTDTGKAIWCELDLRPR